eukprot:Platyproteum_vivax@DN15144_c0_g1_i1.p2
MLLFAALLLTATIIKIISLSSEDVSTDYKIGWPEFAIVSLGYVYMLAFGLTAENAKMWWHLLHCRWNRHYIPPSEDSYASEESAPQNEQPHEQATGEGVIPRREEDKNPPTQSKQKAPEGPPKLWIHR